jgi:hypothetical protein
MVVVPLFPYLVVAGILPVVFIAAPALLAPILAVALSDGTGPMFQGATAGATALLLSIVIAIGLIWVLWSDLSATYLADVTYLYSVFGVPAAVGGGLGAAVFGGLLGKLTVATQELIRGDVQVKFEF